MQLQLIEPLIKKLDISGIIECSPSDLTFFKHNARRHSQEQIVKLISSIKEFGFTSTILVDEDRVALCGHARLEAARQMKLESVPVRVIIGLTEAQKRALAIADNKIALLSSWDMDQLALELDWLAEVDFPQELTAFSTAEIDIITDPECVIEKPEVDPADLIEADLLVAPVAMFGDHFSLCKHQLSCNDARNADAYIALMGVKKAQMVFTDPPFNVRINGHAGGKGKTRHQEFKMASGEMSSQEFTQFLKDTLGQMCAFSDDGSVHYVCMDWRHQRELLDATQNYFGAPKQMCVWVKDNGGMGSFYRSQHELVYVFRKGETPHINNFQLGQYGRYRTNVWHYAGANSFTGNGKALLKQHPTVKPVALVADAIRDCSKRGGIVADPFAGSGTLILAAERTQRIAYAMELDPKYVDVAIARWQRVTGKRAIHLETGLDWEILGQQRRDAGLIGGLK